METTTLEAEVDMMVEVATDVDVRVAAETVAEQQEVTSDAAAEQQEVTSDAAAEQQEVTSDAAAEQQEVTSETVAEQQEVASDAAAEDVRVAPRRAALSPSRAADFKQCPLLYRFRVVDRIPAPPSPAAARGTLVHSVLERIFDLPAHERTPAAAVALLPGAWDDLVEHEPALAAMVEDDETLDLPTWFEQSAALVHRWFTLEDPTRLEPADRELYVETEVDGLVLRGYVDRLDVAPGGEMRVVDYKTGRAPSERFEAKALFQMKFYALVLWRLRGEVPRLLQLVYLGDGEIVRYVPEERELLALEANVKAVWAAIDRAATTGDWRPRPSRLCDWCDFRELCPAWGGTPPPLPADATARALDPAAAGATPTAEDD